MNQTIERFDKAEEPKVALLDGNSPGSWAEALMGMVPFLAYGLTTVLYEFLPHPNHVWPWGFVACYGVLLIGFVMGWVMGFPRWSYPYGGLILVLTWGWMGIPAQNLWTYNIRILKRYNELLGWWAWIPLVVTAVIALLLTRSLRPLLQLVTGVWHDWTRLSFGLYGLMPWLVWVGFDENRSPYMTAYLVASTVVLTGGALAYMRGAKTSQRALALLAGVASSSAVTTVGNAIYWDGRWEPWMRGLPDRWYQIVWKGAIAGVVFVALMFAPALLSLLCRSVKSMRVA